MKKCSNLFFCYTWIIDSYILIKTTIKKAKLTSGSNHYFIPLMWIELIFLGFYYSNIFLWKLLSPSDVCSGGDFNTFSSTLCFFFPGLFMRTDTQKMSVSSTEPWSTATQSSPSWPSSKLWPTSRLNMKNPPERYDCLYRYRYIHTLAAVEKYIW